MPENQRSKLIRTEMEDEMITVSVQHLGVSVRINHHAPLGVARLKFLKKYGLRMSDRLVLPGLPVISDLMSMDALMGLIGHRGDNLNFQLVSGPPTEPGWFMMHLTEPTSEEPFYLCLSGADHLGDVNKVLREIFDPEGMMMRPPILMKVKVPKDAADDQVDYLRATFAAEPKKRVDCDCGCVQREVHWVDFDYEESSAGPA